MDSGWRVHAASVIGKGHLDLGLPCQDAFDYASKDNWLVAVVCDGAGSASNSEIGAKTCCSAITTFFLDWQKVSGVTECLDYQELIFGAIRAARNLICEVAATNDWEARSMACTVVGAVLHQTGGTLFHIGDGVGAVRLGNGSFVVSGPENGEYVNETFFITQDDWQDHLRLTIFEEPANLLVLMSDGVMPFAMNKGGLFGPFMDPVISYLSGTTEGEGSEALQATLADEKTWKITRDDKSLLVAIRTVTDEIDLAH